MVRILSIDGGGMKGIISAMVLERLEELLRMYSGNEMAAVSDYFDMIGGTSTGAIITALLLAPDENGMAKYSAADIVALYKEHGKEIFQKRPLYPINTLFGLFGTRYKTNRFEEVLDQYLKGLTLEDMRKECIFTAYNTANRKATFFSSVSRKKWERENYQIKDIVLASTAAPTYFPPKQIYHEYCRNNCYIDGGVFANNPTLCVLVESLKLKNHASIGETMVLSVGNACSPEYYEYSSVKHWGFLKWAFPILNILMDGSEETVHYQMKRIFDNLHCQEQYLRIEKHLEEPLPDMDAVSKEDIIEFMDVGHQLVYEQDQNLKQFAKRLIQES